MTARISRRALIAGTGAASAALAAPALAQGATEWRMVTSWPKNLPGPGVTAERLASRISAMSAGRLTVRVYAAGEIVPGLQVFDAVSQGTADMAHTASFFWQGKIKAAAFFTAIPFGLTVIEHMAWIYHRGGQELWDLLYEPFGIKPFMAGNTGTSMGGWFRKEIKEPDDIKGLKIRMPGLGGEVYRQLGATPVSVAPSDIVTSLDSGVIDATEFLGPWSDLAMGFYKVAPFYYWPGFHEPNGTGEALVSLKAWQALPDDLKAVVDNACAAENAFAVAESERQNARALAQLVQDHNVRLRGFPKDMLRKAQAVAERAVADIAREGDLARRIYQSYDLAKREAVTWSKVALQPYLVARNG